MEKEEGKVAAEDFSVFVADRLQGAFSPTALRSLARKLQPRRGGSKRRQQASAADFGPDGTPLRSSSACASDLPLACASDLPLVVLARSFLRDCLCFQTVRAVVPRVVASMRTCGPSRCRGTLAPLRSSSGSVPAQPLPSTPRQLVVSR